MGGLGMAELMVIGIVALIVIGPKDLPEMFRQLGRFTAKARAMAGEFSRAMEQAAKESGAADAANDLKNIASAKSMGLDKVRSAVDGFEKWDPLGKDKPKLKPLTPPAMPAAVPPTVPPTAPVVETVAAAAPNPPAPKPRAPRKTPAKGVPAKQTPTPKAKS
jgi:sec-independent protein translocase protein TatB